MSNENYAVENCPRFSVEDAFVKLMTGAMRLFVIDYGMSVGVLAIADDIETINPAFSAFLIHDHCDVVPRELCSQANAGRIKDAVAPQVSARGRHVKCRCVLIL